MTLTVAEIIIEVRREAERKHGVPDEMAQNWPRFSLVKVVPLCDEVERLTAERDALAGQLAKAREELSESEQEAQALKDEIEYTFTRLGNPLIKTSLA
jgi:chromosome segregation ATPase